MKNVADVYALSPLQQGLFFDTLFAPEAGRYVEQIGWRMHGDLDLAAFRLAWQRLVGRHPVLRTAFMWEGLDQPLQVVRGAAELPWEDEDLRGLAEAEQQRRLADYVRESGRRGFKLSRAPLMRCALLRTGEDVYEFVFGYHHLLLDGWSAALLLRELVLLYEGLKEGREVRLEETRPFRDYIAWLRRQDLGAAEAYWRRALEGFRAATPLGFGRARQAPGDEDYEKREVKFSEQTTAALGALARRRRVTLNTLVQGAWALLLGHHGGGDDVVFGAVVSGRPPSLAGVETMLGLFINTLPVRVRLRDAARLEDWLAELQAAQVEMRQYEYSPLVRVQSWSQVERERPLFESIFNLQNTPADAFLREGYTSLDVRDAARYYSRNSYPVTVIATPGERLNLQIKYDRRRFDDASVARLLAGFELLLGRFVSGEDLTVGGLRGALAEAERGELLVERKKHEEASFGRFKKIKPKAVSVPQGELVTTSTLAPGEPLPLVVAPAAEGLDLAEWAAAHRELLERRLHEHGAILFRGFGLDSAAGFERAASAVCPDLFGEYGDLPREEVGGKVYGSTPYPADRAILFHNESSHLDRWPMRIFFFCVHAAARGGETPVVDCRKVYARLSPATRERFERKGLMYVRNYVEGLDVSWQDFFRTDDRAEVERACARAATSFEWLPDGGLRTRQLRPAVTRHPATGEPVFFNQIQLHHVSFLDPSVRRSLAAMYREEEFPRSVYYGDGAPIEEDVMEEVLAVYRDTAVNFPWQEGDLLVLDNMLTAHGRNPFEGRRKIIVAMGEMTSGAAEAGA